MKIYNGKLEESGANIICHQVNTYGIMGAGVARCIAAKYPEVEKEYSDYCQNTKEIKLGTVLFIKANDNTVIANMFSQNGFSTRTNPNATNYEAMRKCFIAIKTFASQNKCSQEKMRVACPYKIGCGLAGGDWNVVKKILEEEIPEVELWQY